MGRRKYKSNLTIIMVAILLWSIGMVSVSGFGASIQLYEKTMKVTLAILFYTLFCKGGSLTNGVLGLLAYFGISNLYTSIVYGHTNFEYVWLYGLAFLLSKVEIEEKQAQLIGLGYGLLGGVVLFVANFTLVFAGWDGNSVSMIPFFSYAFFAATTYTQKRRNKIMFLAYSAVYFVWLEITASRGSMLFSIVMLLALLYPKMMMWILKKKTPRMILLIMPLLIAAFIASIRNAPFVGPLNQWSYDTFGKPIFNGRDELWAEGFRLFSSQFLFGSGNLAGNWHNSAITCLTGAGAAGYAVWIYGIGQVYKKAARYLDDPYVFGLAVAFLVIWLQQSIEPGIDRSPWSDCSVCPAGAAVCKDEYGAEITL